MKTVLAIDVGNSSGRHLLGWLADGKLQMQEIDRFENTLVTQNGSSCWNLEQIFQDLLKGICKCVTVGRIPDSVAIDSWAIDFVLFNEKNCCVCDPVSYRDARTIGVMDEVFRKIPSELLYRHTGIQNLRFNTIFQLYYLLENQPEQMKKAKELLLIPSYLSYRLSGVKANEYTNATTTQLVNAYEKNWDFELIDRLGAKRELFGKIVPPGTILGPFTPEIAEQTGFSATVMLPPTHDTACAYLAAPNLDGNSIILSSGTWSLLGIEAAEPICSDESLAFNFTNEGGYQYRFRYLKNITGMWMMQEIRRNYAYQYSYDQLANLAKDAEAFSAVVDVEDDCFTKPDSMLEAVQNKCRATGQPIPQTPGELCRCVVNSLAVNYQKTVAQIEKITGRVFDKILIVGGGSQNALLNQATADQTGKVVWAGPTEATAIGNILSQLIALGEIKDMQEARELVVKSFPIAIYTPKQEKRICRLFNHKIF